jgi:uncharacterized Rmd1/YagE family protein
MLFVDFRAIAVGNEINLNKIAHHFGITRKYKWEDALSLEEHLLTGIIREPEHKYVYIFYFGGIVFVNFEKHEITDVLNYLKGIEKSLNATYPFEYVENYKLEINPAVEPSVDNDSMTASNANAYQQEIVAIVLAKSVALEKIETDIDLLLDEIEDVVEYLHQGKLTVSDRQLAKLSARILGFKLNSISYIMLLDKPAITWSNEEAGHLFAKLSIMFELADRYEKIRHKSETLMDITAVFSGLAHAQRGNRLEWAIIVIIAIELALSVFAMFPR